MNMKKRMVNRMDKNEVYIKKSDVMRLLKKHHRNGGMDVDGDWVEGAYSESLYDDIENLPVVQKQIEEDSHYDEFGFVDPFSFNRRNTK